MRISGYKFQSLKLQAGMRILQSLWRYENFDIRAWWWCFLATTATVLFRQLYRDFLLRAGLSVRVAQLGASLTRRDCVGARAVSFAFTVPQFLRARLLTANTRATGSRIILKKTPRHLLLFLHALLKIQWEKLTLLYLDLKFKSFPICYSKIYFSDKNAVCCCSTFSFFVGIFLF